MDKIMNQVLKENTIGIWKLDGNQLYGNDCFLDLIGVPRSRAIWRIRKKTKRRKNGNSVSVFTSRKRGHDDSLFR